eukprot:868983-Prorocentrum_minimum.AAC.1
MSESALSMTESGTSTSAFPKSPEVPESARNARKCPLRNGSRDLLPSQVQLKKERESKRQAELRELDRREMLLELP